MSFEESSDEPCHTHEQNLWKRAADDLPFEPRMTRISRIFFSYPHPCYPRNPWSFFPNAFEQSRYRVVGGGGLEDEFAGERAGEERGRERVHLPLRCRQPCFNRGGQRELAFHVSAASFDCPRQLQRDRPLECRQWNLSWFFFPSRARR